MAKLSWTSAEKRHFSGFFSKYEDLDEELCRIGEEIKERLINNLTPLNPGSFNRIPAGEGVYLFCYAGDINEVFSLWKEHVEKCKNVSPFNKRKYNKCKKKAAGPYPMYIGKSENLHKRINEHWNEPCVSETKAMRLKPFLEANNLNLSKVLYSYANLDDVGMKKSVYYVCSAIEHLRKNALNPFIGR